MRCEQDPGLLDAATAYCALGKVEFVVGNELKINNIRWGIKKILTDSHIYYSTPTLALSYIEGGEFLVKDISYFKRSEILVPADSIALLIRKDQISKNKGF